VEFVNEGKECLIFFFRLKKSVTISHLPEYLLIFQSSMLSLLETNNLIQENYIHGPEESAAEQAVPAVLYAPNALDEGTIYLKNQSLFTLFFVPICFLEKQN